MLFRSELLANVSHEFRTPLNVILGYLDLVHEGTFGGCPPEMLAVIAKARGNAAYLLDLVAEFLDLAKVEAGRVEISAAWFEMVNLFSALRGIFKPVLTNPDVALIFEEPQGVPKLFSDDRKLSQILRNFISNALKFTARGEVRVSAAMQGDDTITFSVADTGIGIAPEHHHAIFQDFVQIDSPIQKRLRGTGLGLALSRRLAELLGGTVGFTSEPGRGSTFHVTLPLHWRPPELARTEGPPPEGLPS